MNNELQIDSKVKIQRKSENGGSFTEVARGRVVGFSQGKNNLFIKFVEFIDNKWSNIPLEFSETIPTDAPCIRVVKW